MRILVVSTVYNSTPPTGYGGIQRVVHYLNEGLAALGHELILLAPPKSWCQGRTIHVDAYDPGRPWKEVRGEEDLLSEEPLYEAMKAFLDKEEVDVIHDWSFFNLYVRRHPERAPFVISTCIPPGEGYQRPNLVASCSAHARLIGGSTRYVHYGLPLSNWPHEAVKRSPPIHIAKIARIKAQHMAVLAAMKAGSELDVAGNVENRLYYNLVMRPLFLLASRVRYLGEINGTREHLLKAKALIQTPRWFDCFPLVVLEALASATPVIALPAGGVPEQVKHGETGFLCQNVSELAEAIERLDEIDPMACRSDAEARFSNLVMAREYLSLYQQAIDGAQW